MYSITFTGFVNEEVKNQVEKLLNNQGIITTEKFPSKLEGTFIEENLKYSNLKSLKFHDRGVLKQKLEKACTEFSVMSVYQASTLVNYINKVEALNR